MFLYLFLKWVLLRLEVLNPSTNEKGTVIGLKSGLVFVPYCTASNTPGTILYSSISERIIRGTVPNRTLSERIGTITNFLKMVAIEELKMD